jgi:hypothetical protein
MRTQAKLVQQNTPQVKTNIIYLEKDRRILKLSNISESDLLNLKFLTNTDKNNNYLYLEKAKVYLNYENEPFEIPGLSDMLNEVLQNSDTKAFLNDEKTHTPYTSESFNGLTLGEFIDSLTDKLPFLQKTEGIHKIFTILLNPDCNYLSSCCMWGCG